MCTAERLEPTGYSSIWLYLVPVSSGSVTDIAIIILRFFICGGGSPHSKERRPRVPGKGEGWDTFGTGINEIR